MKDKEDDGRVSDVAETVRMLGALSIVDVAIEPPSLESVFLQHYRTETTGHE